MRYSFIALVISLSACSSPVLPPDQSELPATQVSVVNWRGGAATVEALVYSNDGEPTKAASGTVTATGELEFALEPLKTNHLNPFNPCPELSVSETTLKTNAFSAFSVIENSTRVGRLALVSAPSVLAEGLRAEGDYYVQYTYANRAARLIGRCVMNGVAAAFEFDLSLRKGWNSVIFRLVDNEELQTLELVSTPVPPNAVWALVK